MKILTAFLSGLLFLALPSHLLAETNSQQVTDGPYIAQSKHNHQQLNIQWICQGKVHQRTIKKENLPVVFNECGLQATINDVIVTPSVITLDKDIKVAALSDIHGQHQLFLSLLRNNGIIDGDNNWQFGNGHFVITGDVFDRGPQVTQSLWFLYHLERQARQSGGALHLLLGNHEVMVLNRDLRYLNKKYPKVEQLLNTPFEQLFNSQTVLGQWLRAKPVALRINNMLFAHGGFHPSLVTKQLSVADINQQFSDSLIKAELAAPRQGIGKFLHKRNGPIWYRGFFASDQGMNIAHEDIPTAVQFSALLAHFKVDYFIVGHTSQTKIESRYDGHVIAIDSSMKNGKNAEILLINNSGNENKQTFIRGQLSGFKVPLSTR